MRLRRCFKLNIAVYVKTLLPVLQIHSSRVILDFSKKKLMFRDSWKTDLNHSSISIDPEAR
jgi:hypothetical protein